MQVIDCATRRNNGSSAEYATRNQVCSRHVLVFGQDFQRLISSLTVGVVCVGGLGSIIAEQLMRLYPKKLVLIDNDVVELSNLNRLVGATLTDARLGTKKVDLVHRNVLSFNPDQDIVAIHGDFLLKSNQERLKECDFVFGATDSNAVRHAANRLCLAHGIPYLDCGVGANVIEGKLVSAGGQVILVQPDSGFCLHCSGWFPMRDSISEFSTTEEQGRQQNQGYIRGTNVAAPQVYQLNMMVASWAVWLFMRLVAGEQFDIDGISINALDLTACPWKGDRTTENNCPTCGRGGVTFSGDSVDLLAKEESESEVFPAPSPVEPVRKSGYVLTHAVAAFWSAAPTYTGIVVGDDYSGQFDLRPRLFM